MPLRIVRREEWSSSPTLFSPSTPMKVTRIFTQNAYSVPCEDEETCEGTVRWLQQKVFNNKGNIDMRYNFLVGEDGNVYEARGWNVLPQLPRRFHRLTEASLLIGFLGNYAGNDVPKRIDQTTSDLIQHGVREGHISADYHYYDIMQQRVDNNPRTVQPAQQTSSQRGLSSFANSVMPQQYSGYQQGYQQPPAYPYGHATNSYNQHNRVVDHFYGTRGPRGQYVEQRPAYW